LPKQRAIRFNFINSSTEKIPELIKELVELRGALRHHSIGDPRRWNPNNQDEYLVEAVFLGGVCLSLAFPNTTNVLWKADYIQAFLEQAKRSGNVTELNISISIRLNEKPDEIHFKMTVPQVELDAQVARAVLVDVIKKIEERTPGAEILSIRAQHSKRGSELFRYDLGPSIYR